MRWPPRFVADPLAEGRLSRGTAWNSAKELEEALHLKAEEVVQGVGGCWQASSACTGDSL